MNRTAQPLLLLVTGAAVLRASLFSDLCLRYVKEGLRPLLVITGVALVLVGLLGVLRDVLPSVARHPAGTGQHHGGAPSDGHDHAKGLLTSWLLLPPALALLFFAPPALGSYTAARNSPKEVELYERFERLPAQGVAPLSLTEFIARAQQDDRKSLRGRTVLLAGFVTPRKDGAWDLTRLQVACCAADSRSLTVTMHGVQAPPADSWVEVSGTWHPVGELGTRTAALALDVTSLERVSPPSTPYLDRAPVPGPG
ncbi:TIGR03943 family putative permease subunit [Streptomyces sp. NPDC058685]|uniref:TIGR03943 family putative permease subunit n=1 Tax=Streptomyces sp. NPDC058685 TaxID=3346598 RepID=UPI0036589BD4